MQHDGQAAAAAAWVPLAAAARQLGISVDTARRRIKKGQWPAGATRQRSTAQGFTWEVDLGALRIPAADPGSTPAEAPPTRAHPAAEAGHLAALLREAQAEALRRAEAAAMWQARAEMLAGQLEQAQTELRALKAPDAGPPAAAPPAPEQEPPKRWWRFW
jgi:hypothetical protein